MKSIIVTVDKYILDGHTPIPEPDLLAWGRWMETADRHVGYDYPVPDVRVSTVFLGIDHRFQHKAGDGGPLVFETMIFGGVHDGYQERYVSWREAEAGHRQAVLMAPLRRQLTPLYRALQSVFSELDAAGVVEETIGYASSTNNPAPPRTSAVWESWKSRMPGGPAKIIDALLVHGEMNTQQLAIATGVHRNSVPAMIFKLNKAGLLNKNGGRFSLKAL